jgi:hypothetical protein
MTFQTLFLAGVILAFGGLFAVLMYAWIITNLPQRAQAPAQATPAQRPPLKLAA